MRFARVLPVLAGGRPRYGMGHLLVAAGENRCQRGGVAAPRHDWLGQFYAQWRFSEIF